MGKGVKDEKTKENKQDDKNGRLGGGNKKGERRRKRVNVYVKIQWKDSIRKRRKTIMFLKERR